MGLWPDRIGNLELANCVCLFARPDFDLSVRMIDAKSMRKLSIFQAVSAYSFCEYYPIPRVRGCGDSTLIR